MNRLNEAALIEGARSGDRGCQEALVKLYEGRVYSLILRLVANREDARDILQDTMIKALTSVNLYDERYPFASWLFRIATNRSLDFLRRRKLEFRIFEYEGEWDRDAATGGSGAIGGRGAAGDVVSGAASDAAGGSAAGASARAAGPIGLGGAGEEGQVNPEMVVRCMDRLAPKYRTVLHLRYREDLAYKEIAEVLAIPIGTVKALLHRARAELKKQVLAEIGTPGGTSQ